VYYIFIAPGGVLKVENMGRVTTYLKETRGELKHVSWPTRRQAIVFTVVVVIISLGVAAYLGLFDFLFTALVKLLV